MPWVVKKTGPMENHKVPAERLVDYPVSEWIHLSDGDPILSVPSKYWKIENDQLVEMDQAEKDAYDSVVAAKKDARRRKAVAGRMLVPDPETVSPELRTFVEDNAIWTDEVTGLFGPPCVVLPLLLQREIFGNQDNPLGGYEGNILGRLSGFDQIHGKLGWHNQQVHKALYRRPKDVLFYYGYVSSFNYPENSYNNEYVAQNMAMYNIVVLGDGVQSTLHPDYANTTAVIQRIKALNPSTKIFGYVTTNQDLASFSSRADEWNTLGVHGIFMDEAGYNYGTVQTNGRDAFNAKVDYVHDLASSSLVFANAWNLDNVVGTVDDPSWPNETYNPSGFESNLSTSDWVLLESFPINTTAYTASTPVGYEPREQWASRGQKAVTLRSQYGVNVAAVGIINDDNASGQDLFNFMFVSACQFSLDAVGSSSELYGASGGDLAAQVRRWNRPDVSKIGSIYSLSPSVTQHALDPEVYIRYLDSGRLVIYYTDSGQMGVISDY